MLALISGQGALPALIVAALRERPLIASLEQFMPAGWLNDPKRRRSVTASTFAAMLELVKLGKLDLRQNDTFSQIEIKQKEN